MAKSTAWLLYPRRSFIICRILQVIISLTFLIFDFTVAFSISGRGFFAYSHGPITWGPLFCCAFLIYLSTLISYLCNPTRLSRVLDPLDQNSRAPTLLSPNIPNLSRRGVTITIVILEFLTVLYGIGTFIGGIFLVEWDLCHVDYYGYEYRGNLETGPCMAWWLGNLVIGNVVMGALGIVTFWQGVQVYRAGWRESCRKEVEREILERVGTVQDKESRDPEGAVELGAVELGAVELRAAELRAAELRAAELRVAELRAAELRAAELRVVELRAVELGAIPFHH